MKSLLYKEFAASKSMILFFAFYCVAGVIAAGTGAGLTLSYLGFILTASLLIRSSAESEKSGWDKLSRALPHTTAERVGANYLFWLSMLLAMTLFVVVSGVAAGLTSDTYNGDWEKLLTGWVPLYIPLYVFWLGMALVSSSIALVIRYSVSGSFKSILISVAFMPSFYSFFLLAFSGTLSGRTNVITSVCKPKNTVLIIVSAFLLFAASYFISVIIETKSGREKLKAVKAVAAVLTVAALAVSGTTVYALYKDGAFEKIDFSYSSDYEEKLEQSEAELEKQYALAREEMLKYVDEFCGETLVDKKTEYIKERISAIGFGDRFTEIDQVYSTEYPLAVAIHTYGNSEHPDSPDMIKIYANVDAATIMTDGDPVELAKQIEDMFSEGLEEERMVEFMKTYGLCPDVLNENLDGEKPYKTYCFDMIIEEHIPKNYVSVSMTLNIDVMDGAIWDTRAYVIEDTKSPQTK